MVEFDLSKITGREPPVETDEDMMNALADALGDADALRTERDALRERNRELATLTNELRAKSAALANELRAADEALGDYTVNIIRSLPEAAAALRARVAELEAIEKAARELVNEGMRNNGYALCVVEKPDNSDPHYRLCTLLERATPSAGAVPE